MNHRLRSRHYKTRLGPFPKRCPNGHPYEAFTREDDTIQRTVRFGYLCRVCHHQGGTVRSVSRQETLELKSWYKIDQELKDSLITYVGASR